MVININTPPDISQAFGTMLTTHEGHPLKGVRSAVVSMEMHKAITAKLEVFAHLEGISATPRSMFATQKVAN